jgi:hypothetical protein
MDPAISNLITGLVGGVGIGAVVTALVQYLLERNKSIRESQRKDLEARYRVVILLLYAAVDFEANREMLRTRRPELGNKQAVLEELQTEWVNMVLFASSATLSALRAFIAEPSRSNLLAAAQAMRADLGRGKVVVPEWSA